MGQALAVVPGQSATGDSQTGAYADFLRIPCHLCCEAQRVLTDRSSHAPARSGLVKRHSSGNLEALGSRREVSLRRSQSGLDEFLGGIS
eukprot:jgi/Mesen1/2775/ME000170S01884